MSLDTFVQDAWRDHGDDPLGVAGRLRTSTHLIASATDFAPYARLVTHVFGEHLMQLNPGIDLLESLRELSVFDGSTTAHAPVARAIATLKIVGHDPEALHGLADEDCVGALAGASGIYTALNDMALASQSLQGALAAVHPQWSASSPAHRALAVAGNNLAAALEEKASSTDAERTAMLMAAQTGLTYWKLAGTWLEEERAEYQLTRCLLRAGDAATALASAQRCLDVCQRNDAPAFELFFANAVLALACRASGDSVAFAAHRDAALQHYGRVPDDEKTWCSREFGELG